MKLIKYIFKCVFWSKYFDLAAWTVLSLLFLFITLQLWQDGVLLRVWNAINTQNSSRAAWFGAMAGLVGFQVFSVLLGLWRLIKK